MQTANGNTPSLWRIIFNKWPTLALVPAINAICMIVFWQSQLAHYSHSTKGILLMWLVAGLVFVVLQLSLQTEALRQTHKDIKDIWVQKETRWSLGTQITLFVVAATYNAIALVQLVRLGVRPTSLFDIIIGLILCATAVLGIVLYRRSLTSPGARLLFATGTKAVPQWLQAIWLAVQGSAGMHIATISAISAMGITRYILTRHAQGQFATAATIAANKAAWRDLLSIVAMAAGWLLGRM